MAGAVTSFIETARGAWTILRSESLIGAGVALREMQLDIRQDAVGAGNRFCVRGIQSNIRYANRAERRELVSRQEGLGRPEATIAALIPISKTDEWWALAQDERRSIFEESSRHHSIGLEYLPQIARRLYHSRDLGEAFDFLTWFEFAPEHEEAFNDLVARLRASLEWKYVSREVDIRLRKNEAASA